MGSSRRQAIIPAAGRGRKPYPAWDTAAKLLAPMLDQDGQAKPALLLILAEDCFDAGIDEIVLVVAPGEAEQYQDSLAELGKIFAVTDIPSQAALSQVVERLTSRADLCCPGRGQGPRTCHCLCR